MKYIFSICLLFFISQSSLFAAHIIGGEITYKCLGNGDYEFTMKIYRDCFGGGADFDSGPNGAFIGSMTVYHGSDPTPFLNFDLGPPSITSIQPNLSNPCLIAPPNICVEQGVYTFNLNLPQSPQSYHLTYQRCCRNNSISNIVNPGESGATYTMELRPLAQSSCNSSPVFNDFPPIVICTGEDINFDHSATDAEGDNLVYELCSPFLGGGIDQINSTSPNGVAPDPDMPPPYNDVNFIFPPYSTTNPMGGSPQVTINPNTGLITGTPTVIGQFVVGVCVKEFRNGLLLSVTRRDFQFNVAQCDPTVVADIAEDELVMQNDDFIYIINDCGGTGVQLQNQSFQQQYINEFIWEFDINGFPVTNSTTWDFSHNFPGIGSYIGSLILNPGTTCSDTANIIVNIFPDVHPDFEFEYDTCMAGPTIFTDLSVADAGPGTITEWNWDFGDGQTDTLQNPIHIYMIPGNLPATLEIVDINGCRKSITHDINYFPVPSELIIAPSEFIGCQPATITFNNLSFPIDDTYDIHWEFGDGGFGTDISPTHIYEDLGVFTVSLSVVSPIGCMTDTVWNDLITILPSPIADFTYDPRDPSNLQPLVNFTDLSIDAVKWKWDFGLVGGSIEQNPTFNFPDTGMQEIQLVVWHESGCRDTAIQVLDVMPEVRYFLPNAFTPNGDGINDGFRGNGVMEGATGFILSIWNRYGEKLFETTDPFLEWNGKKNNTGELSLPGVYVVVVNYTGPRGQREELRGFATLIR